MRSVYRQPLPCGARSNGGFTLIELIVTIVITGIVVGFVAVFMVTPMESYYAQTRRAALVNGAEMIRRNLSFDVISALPNSVRTTPSCTAVCALEMLATSDSAIYWDSTWTPPPAPPPPNPVNIGGTPVKVFDALTPFSATGNFTGSAAINPTPAIWFVFGNSPGQITPAQSITVTNNGTRGRITLTSNFTFQPASPNHRVFLVTGPVSYICDNGAQTLRRYSGYTPTSAQPTSAPVGAVNALIAQGITCTSLTHTAATSSNGELVTLQATLNNNGDTLAYTQQAAVLTPP